jgi:hypothetical protein
VPDSPHHHDKQQSVNDEIDEARGGTDDDLVRKSVFIYSPGRRLG